MSESTPTPADVAAKSEQTPPPAEAPTTAEPAQEQPDWKALARKWESRAKENADAATRLAEIEEANKTEEQKRAEHVAALEARVAQFEAAEQIRLWKAAVATETGVPVDVLAGTTLEDIEAHAEKLKPLIDKQPEPAPTGGGKIHLGSQPPAGTGAGSLDDQIALAEAEGDRKTAAVLKAQKLAQIAG